MSRFQLVPVFCAIINFFVQASAFRDYLASKQNVITEDDNYRLSGNELKALYPRLNGTVTANAWIYHTQPLKTIEFKYNSSGLRVQKKVTANGKSETTDYILHGKLVTHMTVGNDKLHFFYDAQSRPMKVRFNGTIYTYLHNLQGDIVGILDSNGALVVEYKYDAWGKPLSTTGSLADTLGVRNPFRYRGYVFDEESGRYWLKSRFYAHDLLRFINADTLLGVNHQLFSHNVYGYAANRPVVCGDKTGCLTAYILYDSRENTDNGEIGGFVDQADYYERLLRADGYRVVMLGYTNMSDEDTGFIARWNSMEESIDRLVILGHGAPGSIDARGESLVADRKDACNFGMLNKKTIGYIELYTCEGATPDENGISAAYELSKRAGNCRVRALYYAKTWWPFNKYLVAKPNLRRRKAAHISLLVPLFVNIYASEG